MFELWVFIYLSELSDSLIVVCGKEIDCVYF
jgi:hypothetical protein